MTSTLPRRALLVAIFPAVLLGNCDDEIGDQEKRVAIVDRGANEAAKCEEHQKLAQLRLKAIDSERYELEKNLADQICSNAQMKRELLLK